MGNLGKDARKETQRSSDLFFPPRNQDKTRRQPPRPLNLAPGFFLSSESESQQNPRIPGLVMTNSLLLKMAIYSGFSHEKW